MLQAHPIGVPDATNSSQSGARKDPHPVHDVLPRSKRSKTSLDCRNKTTKAIGNNRRQHKEKRRHANIADGKRVTQSGAESHRNEARDGTTCPKSLAQFENPAIDFDGLRRPGVGTHDRLGESPEESAARLDRLKGAVRTLLECVGENPNREGLLATPERYAKAMLYFTKGYEQNVSDIVNGAIFHEQHNEMVIVKDIEIHSLCEHHLVPFTGIMHIGYIPKSSVIGLSKLARIAEMFGRRLQVQERLTKSVANTVFEVLQPQGVAVVMESNHLCMAMRGVQKTSSTTVTSCMIGCFERRSKTRMEFLSLIKVNR